MQLVFIPPLPPAKDSEDCSRVLHKRSSISRSRYCIWAVSLIHGLSPPFLPLFPPIACYNINQWPLPRPGQVLQLPLMGQLIQVCLGSQGCIGVFKFLSVCAYIHIQVRLPTKTDKPGGSRASEMDVVRRSVRTPGLPPVCSQEVASKYLAKVDPVPYH